MPIVPYEPDLARAVADCYNALTAGLRHCYPVSAERLGPILAGEHPPDRLSQHQAWVALEGSAAVGFAQAAIEAPDEHRGGPRGAIRFVGYLPGQRAAGQALLEAAEAYLREQSMPEVIAFHQDHRWPCYHFEHAYLTDRLTHLEGLLGQNGYQRVAGEVYLDWPDFVPPEPPPTPLAAEFRREIPPGSTTRYPSFGLLAFQGDRQIGECWGESCGANAPGTAAEDWCLTAWLHIAEDCRGQGLGAHLLARALHEARDLGFRHAAISTSRENWRAQLFYSNFGYRTSDWTYAWGRAL